MKTATKDAEIFVLYSRRIFTRKRVEFSRKFNRLLNRQMQYRLDLEKPGSTMRLTRLLSILVMMKPPICTSRKTHSNGMFQPEYEYYIRLVNWPEFKWPKTKRFAKGDDETRWKKIWTESGVWILASCKSKRYQKWWYWQPEQNGQPVHEPGAGRWWRATLFYEKHVFMFHLCLKLKNIPKILIFNRIQPNQVYGQVTWLGIGPKFGFGFGFGRISDLRLRLRLRPKPSQKSTEYRRFNFF